MARVIVYKNLKRGDWSIAAVSGRDGTGRGKVIDHASSLTLANCVFFVQESGRQRVMRVKQREVHAWIIGEVVDTMPTGQGREVTYNPYRGPSFTLRDGSIVDHASFVQFTASQGAIAYGVES